MSRLIVFNQVSADGYFTDANNDIRWAKERNRDPEFQAFVADNAKSGGTLLFGRVTYEMMKSYWPTPEAKKNDPVVAEQMNILPKVVFSKTLDEPSWNNTRLVKDGMASEVRKLKKESGPQMVIMGSGTIVSQLTNENLIDEYQFVVYPIILGKGRSMFEGVQDKLDLKLKKSRTFGNGIVLVTYETR